MRAVPNEFSCELAVFLLADASPYWISTMKWQSANKHENGRKKLRYLPRSLKTADARSLDLRKVSTQRIEFELNHKPRKPSRDEIRPQVADAIYPMAEGNGAKENSLRRLKRDRDETLSMEADLFIFERDRKDLSIAYSKISQSYIGGLAVSPAAAGAAKTVGQAVDMVFAKANGK